MNDHFWHLCVTIVCSIFTGAMFAKGFYVWFGVFLVGLIANAMSCVMAHDDKEGE